MNTKERQTSRGFSLIAVLSIVLVITAVGLGGWYVWNENKQDNKKSISKSLQTNKDDKAQTNETDTWALATTQGKPLV